MCKRLVRYSLPAALGVCAALGCLSPVSGIPVFARKYGFQCTMCHSNIPRLNDFGVRYRQNGYQIPGREEDERTILETPAPFAARTSVGLNYEDGSDSADVRQFQINGLDLLSGGLLGRGIGYLLVYPPKIEESRGIVGQPGTVEMASVVFSNIASRWVNVRAGRFEPEYVAFSVKRSLSVAPYEVYEYAFPGGPPFSETREGIEITGYDRDGFAYALGWINGSATNNPSDGPGDAYIRLSKVFGQGQGQTAGQRVGLAGYLGRARPETGGDLKTFTRFGGDASLNLGHWNLALQYLAGRDHRTFWGAGADANFSGGFAELSLLPSTSFVAFGRFDWVQVPSDAGPDIQRWSIGGRYYFEDNIALHLEYSKREQSGREGPRASTDFLTLRLDLAF